jgi:hypothetical protein
MCVKGALSQGGPPRSRPAQRRLTTGGCSARQALIPSTCQVHPSRHPHPAVLPLRATGALPSPSVLVPPRPESPFPWNLAHLATSQSMSYLEHLGHVAQVERVVALGGRGQQLALRLAVHLKRGRHERLGKASHGTGLEGGEARRAADTAETRACWVTVPDLVRSRVL